MERYTEQAQKEDGWNSLVFFCSAVVAALSVLDSPLARTTLAPAHGAAARISDGAAQRCRRLPRSQAAHAPGETRQDQRRGYELRENRLPGCTTGRGQHSVPSNHGITILITD